MMRGALALGLALCACAGECVGVSAACMPLYAPDYDEIFARTLTRSCAQPGPACHAPEGARGGLVFAEAESSYQRLLGQTGRPALVQPGQAGCSPLVQRLESTDPRRQMPPGAPLPVAERCAIVQWIERGAPR
ncbi:MAG: c-type cytochrome domain-containing protein [Myxococcales bacterium]|nr:hypothetical protein [Myxococcota bacterium]MDW8280288.1 c-type cytochrome domain-containing protein [Myxococcales bacterium]